MPKRIRNYPVMLAPQIISSINNGNLEVLDQRTKTYLNPTYIDDKIKIYEQQVKGWFLERASALVSQNDNYFIVLMICLSYIEGIEQYRIGQSSRGQSLPYFRNSLNRLYPNSNFTQNNLDELYSEARCGLFHTGMTEGKIVVSYEYERSIDFPDQDTIRINPKKLLEDIILDFNQYIIELRNDEFLRRNFNRMFNNLG